MIFVTIRKQLTINLLQCSLFQFGGAIAQGVQAHRIGNLAELADKAYLTLSVSLFSLACVTIA